MKKEELWWTRLQNWDQVLAETVLTMQKETAHSWYIAKRVHLRALEDVLNETELKQAEVNAGVTPASAAKAMKRLTEMVLKGPNTAGSARQPSKNAEAQLIDENEAFEEMKRDIRQEIKDLTNSMNKLNQKWGFQARDIAIIEGAHTLPSTQGSIE